MTSDETTRRPLLALAGVTKRFHRVTAAEDISFTVHAGEIVGLIGPNGAGKSTTLSLCCAELIPDAGTIHVAGSALAEDPIVARQAIGYVPQRLALFPFLTGEELLDIVGEAKGLSPDESAAQRDRLLTELELDEARDRLSREYSEGMARKLSLAAALIGEPPLLVLDESLNGLDPRAVAGVKTMLQAHAARGGAVLIASHVLETMERLCTRILLFQNGHILDDMDGAALQDLRDSGTSLEEHFLARTSA